MAIIIRVIRVVITITLFSFIIHSLLIVIVVIANCFIVRVNLN